jgi:uncharacterized cupin superfamily protein
VPKIEIDRAPLVTGTKYPRPFDEPCRARENRQLGIAAGLAQFGVNLTRLPPGTWSSQRQPHRHEDEFIYVLEAKAGERNGHHLQNRSPRDAVLLTVGARDDRDEGEYSDIEMVFKPGRYAGTWVSAHKDGTTY